MLAAMMSSVPIARIVWPGHFGQNFRLGGDTLAKPDSPPPPLIRKAVYTQRVMAAKSKYNWWSNSWRILNHFRIKESDPTDPPAMSPQGGDTFPVSLLVVAKIR